MILLRFIADRWDAQRNAKIERRVREMAENAIMTAIDITEPNKRRAEYLKLKLTRIALKEEIREERGDNWDPPYKGDENRTPEIAEQDAEYLKMKTITLFSLTEERGDDWNPPYKGDENDTIEIVEQLPLSSKEMNDNWKPPYKGDENEGSISIYS